MMGVFFSLFRAFLNFIHQTIGKKHVICHEIVQETAFKQTVKSFRQIETFLSRKKGGKDQESIQSSTTPDTGHHMRKRQKHN